MTFEQRAKLDIEALTWFNTLVYGFACYHLHTDSTGRDKWYGHPRSHEEERQLEYHRLLRLTSAFKMSYKFEPNPNGEIPQPRRLGGTWV